MISRHKLYLVPKPNNFRLLKKQNPIKMLIIDFLIYQYCWDGTVQIISKEICSIPRFNETNISPWVALQLDQILIHPLHISFQIINTSKYIHTENTLRWTAKHILEKFRFFVYIVHILQRCKTFFDKFKVWNPDC